MAELADRLQYLRRRENLTQRELADKIGVSSGTIARYECGKRMPGADIEESLARYFNVSLDELRGRQITTNYSITQEEFLIIEAYRELPKAEKDMIKRMLAYNERLHDMPQKSMKYGITTTGKKLLSELTNYQGVKKKK